MAGACCSSVIASRSFRESQATDQISESRVIPDSIEHRIDFQIHEIPRSILVGSLERRQGLINVTEPGLDNSDSVLRDVRRRRRRMCQCVQDLDCLSGPSGNGEGMSAVRLNTCTAWVQAYAGLELIES